MAPQVRFNAFGIPYLVEFANVSFRSRSRSGSTSTTDLSSDTQTLSSSLHKPTFERRPSRLRPSRSIATFDSDWTFATASSETLAGPSVRKESPSPTSLAKSKPLPDITIESEIETGGQGLLIRFASQLPHSPRKLSHNRLARLKYRIAKAVMAAGMDSSPAIECADPMDTRAEAAKEAYRASVCSIRSEEVETRGMPASLFRGTYGQVMTALKAAGLVMTPCSESGVEDATRLGALFVAHQNPYGGVEFTKLTLWA
ncbi:hypothetical protein K466DRAFT_104441 [Polyporus arcularius HHB13444]|uniref:Uncharacterized protein n=1 Tax=Polyporus arcularius HHB13444 TaxID=1314778 RepID=A0A5C3PCY0_9APHY|nr:hypothetical protein K466DRAFT_104441 [Polyporus arcularius HHB13444]